MKKVILIFSLALSFFSCGEEIDCCVMPTSNLFVDAKANGCASFYVYKESATEFLHLAVQGDREKLNLDLTQKSFDLSNPDLTVELLKFDGEIGNYACDDVVNDQAEIETIWNGISGTVHIQIVEDSISVNSWEVTYKLNVTLENVILENDENETTTFDKVEFTEVLVGWLPG